MRKNSSSLPQYASKKGERYEEDGSIAVSKTFSFSDGFIVKRDQQDLPARFQKNEIALFLELTKGSNGELLLTPTKPEDADDL